MKKYSKLVVVFALIAIMVCSFAACNTTNEVKGPEITPFQIQVGNGKAVDVKSEDVKNLKFEDVNLKYEHKGSHDDNYKALKLVDILKAIKINDKVTDLDVVAKDKHDLTKPATVYDKFNSETKDINKLYLAFKIEKDGKFVVGNAPILFQENEIVANQIVQYVTKLIINPVEEPAKA